jgi:hypothetical protein
MKIKTLLFFLLCFSLKNLAFAQADTSSIPPFLGAEYLKNGTLVLRLSTGSSKIKALKKLLNSPNTSPANRQRYQTMLDASEVAIQNQNRWLVDAFRTNYSFSKLLLMPDTASTALKDGTRQGIFLNDSLEIDPSITLQGNFLVAYYGQNTLPEYQHNEGINVLGPTLEPMHYPFPAFVGITGIRRTFNEIFNKRTDSEFFTELVMKFQKQLTEL